MTSVKLCEQFHNNYLCHRRINRYPTCQISLIERDYNIMSTTILPHPPAIIRSSLESKTKTLVFDGQTELRYWWRWINKNRKTKIEPNPWHHREMISNNEDDITIFFGSHTTLHSWVFTFTMQLKCSNRSSLFCHEHINSDWWWQSSRWLW